MSDQLHVTQIHSSIGTKPKHRGTLRALGLRRLGQSNTLPDRPEIRGMIARVPHLVRVEHVRRRRPRAVRLTEGTDESSRPAARRRVRPERRRRVGRGIAGKGGKTAGRGTKGQGARNNIKPGFEGGQLPLKQRIPKLKGFKNPFRVEYVVVNLDTLEAFDGDRGHPRRACAPPVWSTSTAWSRCSAGAS